jgi:hypothetical protein
MLFYFSFLLIGLLYGVFFTVVASLVDSIVVFVVGVSTIVLCFMSPTGLMYTAGINTAKLHLKAFIYHGFFIKTRIMVMIRRTKCAWVVTGENILNRQPYNERDDLR